MFGGAPQVDFLALWMGANFTETQLKLHVPPMVRPLLKLSRETIECCQKTEYALVSSLQRDPMLADRIKRLRTVPGVGPITALTWALEIGNVSGFRTIKQAISQCGLCGDERSSADKAMRMPLSKQRNKHIQRTLSKLPSWLRDRAMS